MHQLTQTHRSSLEMHVHTTMARPPCTRSLLVLLIALAGVADLASASAFGSDDQMMNTLLSLTPSAAAGGGGDAEDLNSMMQCMMGCLTQEFGCALGCMGKGPDLPLCIIICDSKNLVCMIRCGLSPSPPPSPKPPTPLAPKPPAPKPPAPGPPYVPPYAGGRTTETYT